MLKTALLAGAALAATAIVTAPAFADTVIPTQPSWATADKSISAGDFFSDTWLVSTNSTVLVTDFAVVGDNYNIFDNGVLVASTDVADWSVSDPTNSHYTSDPNVGWANSLFAHASFSANAGDEITIQSLTIPSGFPDATVAISIAAVPEASTWGLMLLGFAGLGLAGLRSTRKGAALAA